MIEGLITQRIESARLSTELAEAKAESAEIQETSRQQEALLSALKAAVASRERQTAERSGTAVLRQRLEAAQAELQRQRGENERLAAELAAAYEAADEATVIAQENLAAINAQLRALHAAAGNLPLAGAERPPELLSAECFDVAPSVPWQKSHLEATR